MFLGGSRLGQYMFLFGCVMSCCIVVGVDCCEKSFSHSIIYFPCEIGKV